MARQGRLFEGAVFRQLRNLRTCLSALGVTLDEKQKEFVEWLESEAMSMSAEQRSYLFDAHGDERWRLTEVFPQILWTSIFVTCNSLFEHELLRVCNFMSWEIENPVKPKDLTGKGISQAQAYLKIVAGIEFPDQGEPWGEILKLKRIRNSIVHNGGKLDPSDKEVEKYIDENDLISLDNRRRIQLFDGFCDSVLDRYEEFFKLLFSKLP